MVKIYQNIGDLLKNANHGELVQIHGLSGIGPSELRGQPQYVRHTRPEIVRSEHYSQWEDKVRLETLWGDNTGIKEPPRSDMLALTGPGEGIDPILYADIKADPNSGAFEKLSSFLGEEDQRVVSLTGVYTELTIADFAFVRAFGIETVDKKFQRDLVTASWNLL
jgi:hypothetical protein